MNQGKEIQAMVVDLCPVQGNEQWCSGDMTHFDLGGSTAFAQLEPPVTGVKEITFQWLPTPVGNTPVKLRLKDGVNAYWVAIEVINHRYPVAKLEIKDPQSGAWIAGNRTRPGMYNYWQFDFTGNGLKAPFQIRITDQYGQVIEETGPIVQEKYMWTGINQFPLLPRHVAGKKPFIVSRVDRAGHWPYRAKQALRGGRLRSERAYLRSGREGHCRYDSAGRGRFRRAARIARRCFT